VRYVHSIESLGSVNTPIFSKDDKREMEIKERMMKRSEIGTRSVCTGKRKIAHFPIIT
jgi:hypothetical protein